MVFNMVSEKEQIFEFLDIIARRENTARLLNQDEGQDQAAGHPDSLKGVDWPKVIDYLR